MIGRIDTSKLTNQIKKYVRCPQIDGGTKYGEWGALRLDQRKLVRELCEYCEQQEKWADTFFKETQSLKQQLAEKDKEIEELKKESEDYVIIERNFYNNLQEQLTEMKQIEEMLKQSRHQVCEEIREKLLRLCDLYEDEIGGYWYATEKKINYVLDQIEQGEGK